MSKVTVLQFNLNGTVKRLKYTLSRHTYGLLYPSIRRRIAALAAINNLLQLNNSTWISFVNDKPD